MPSLLIPCSAQSFFQNSAPTCRYVTQSRMGRERVCVCERLCVRACDLPLLLFPTLDHATTKRRFGETRISSYLVTALPDGELQDLSRHLGVLCVSLTRACGGCATNAFCFEFQSVSIFNSIARSLLRVVAALSVNE